MAPANCTEVPHHVFGDCCETGLSFRSEPRHLGFGSHTGRRSKPIPKHVPFLLLASVNKTSTWTAK